MTEPNLTEKKKALIEQIQSLREVFDKAHEQAFRAQDAFEVLKNEINQLKNGADEQVINIKTESEEKIKDILVQIENTKREAASQIENLRSQISGLS